MIRSVRRISVVDWGKLVRGTTRSRLTDKHEEFAVQSIGRREDGAEDTFSRGSSRQLVVDTAAAKLSRSEILVWMILYRDTRNDISSTSQVDIARRAGISTRTVCRAINRLRKRGLLIMIYQGGLNRGPSKYKVLAE